MAPKQPTKGQTTAHIIFSGPSLGESMTANMSDFISKASLLTQRNTSVKIGMTYAGKGYPYATTHIQTYNQRTGDHPRRAAPAPGSAAPREGRLPRGGRSGSPRPGQKRR